MEKIPNKLVIFGAVAAAALVVPGVLGPLMFQQAEAQQLNRGQQTAQGAIAANVGVQANVDVSENQLAVCIITETCEPEN